MDDHGQKSSDKKPKEPRKLEFVEDYARRHQQLEWEHFAKFVYNFLTTTPEFTTIRVNTKNYKSEELVEIFRSQLLQRYGKAPALYIHPEIPDCIVMGPLPSLRPTDEGHPHKVYVDKGCGVAVLRGADIFAPGVLAIIPPGAPVGTPVSIYVDLSKKCLRGQRALFSENRMLVASGVLKMNRHQLFSNNQAIKGVAVEITKVFSGVPHIDVPPDMGVLQNLPSILASHYLDVHPGYKVLDMCAAPGNKLTHIAQLMNDTGTIIALDKSRNRVARLKESIERLNLTSVQAHAFDSTLIGSSDKEDIESIGLKDCSFDRILLDAPCSGAGQRPMFMESLDKFTRKHINSFTHIQRKLLDAALPLLKVDGILVYCTCSLTRQENQDMIEKFLKKHSEVELVPLPLRFGPNNNLIKNHHVSEVRDYMQYFGPIHTNASSSPDRDTIGFFLCKLKKKTHVSR